MPAGSLTAGCGIGLADLAPLPRMRLFRWGLSVTPLARPALWWARAGDSLTAIGTSLRAPVLLGRAGSWSVALGTGWIPAHAPCGRVCSSWGTRGITSPPPVPWPPAGRGTPPRAAGTTQRQAMRMAGCSPAGSSSAAGGTGWTVPRPGCIRDGLIGPRAATTSLLQGQWRAPNLLRLMVRSFGLDRMAPRALVGLIRVQVDSGLMEALLLRAIQR